MYSIMYIFYVLITFSFTIIIITHTHTRTQRLSVYDKLYLTSPGEISFMRTVIYNIIIKGTTTLAPSPAHRSAVR